MAGGKYIFDGIFQGDGMAGTAQEPVHQGGKGGGFAAAGRARNEKEPTGPVLQRGIEPPGNSFQPKLRYRGEACRQNPDSRRQLLF